MNSKTIFMSRPKPGAFSHFHRLLIRISLLMLLCLLGACGLMGRLPAAEQPEDPRDFLMMKLYEAALKAVQTRMEAATSAPTPSPGSGSVSNGPAWTPPDYGCALWLEVARATNNASNVVVTLHNTLPGTNYQILSKTNLNDTNWTTETNVTGASGQDWTAVTIPLLGRLQVYFVAAPSTLLATNFDGISLLDEFSFNNPDSMGAIGPNHFVELLNGQIAVFAKSNGARLEFTNSATFFKVQAMGTNFPTGPSIVDPRILYDHQYNRWVACAIDAGSGSKQVLLAVSTDANPTGLASNWTKHLVPMYMPEDTDYVTMGSDQNGLYLTATHRSGGTNAGHTIVAIQKSELYQPNQTNLPQTRFEIDTDPAGLKVWTVQPAVNFDAIATNAMAWLVAKGPPQWGSNYYGGALLYRRLQWSNTTAQLIDANWLTATQAFGTDYRNYYDLEGTNLVTLPSTPGISAPQAGGSVRIDLGITGSRLMNAVIRDGFLYTCQHIGLSGTNGGYTGNELGTNVDRSAVQWLRFRIEANDTLSYTNHGRIYDTATTNVLYYYFPSIAVNCVGDMGLGFSGSSSNTYIGAYYLRLEPGGSSPVMPTLLKAGEDHFDDDRWGDYSATTLDPSDSTTFWTVQQYSKPVTLFGRTWGTWIGTIRKQ